ncbi:RNA polymerase sigma factor [Streptomyces fulvorobeus]|uniref:RNA polymerase sigma factor n=1 Tax=Streptomyces fulvorobeus TaxID=284028 RepID=A0A7J0C280_9ACTN|nr:sigma-70 family RNA polymerase sigma factor [Streptomyces fulvorobeus]NYE39804.1 RNA polymerase sigma factor (sigma-70 family) [Streptomyces fulvorobeus]GFM96054.1 RNA polymerase sigma factor [Streptomyces fulvorobeus]
MTLIDHAPPPAGPALVHALLPLIRAEARAEAPAASADPADLEQAVWLRLFERLDAQGPPAAPARWVRDAVRAEARRTRRTARHERPYGSSEPPAAPHGCPERTAVRADTRRVLRTAVGRLPGGCARLLEALLSPADPTYREIAGRLGMSQGSLGPMRSRCLGCLRRMLAAEVAAPERRG